MTVEEYLRSLVPGLDLQDNVVERCAISPIEVDLDPLELDDDEEELRIKAEIPAEAKAKYGVDATDTTPKSNPANVDNNAPGKSIQD